MLYKKGKIYKIITAQSNDIYIGSTFNELRHRFIHHKKDYRRWKNNKSGKVSAFELFEKYGVENCKIMLIEEYEVCDNRHLNVYETLWIYKLKSINKNIPFRIKRLFDRKYREENKEKIKEKSKKYREENKEKIKEKNKKYWEENKDQIKEKSNIYHKKYWEENKERLKDKRNDKRNEKIKCGICDLEMNKSSLSRHKKRIHT